METWLALWLVLAGGGIIGRWRYRQIRRTAASWVRRLTREQD